MQPFLQRAFESAETDQHLSISNRINNESNYELVGCPIKIIGVGGAGNDIVNRLYNVGVDRAKIIAVNTDKQHLDVIMADKKLLIGQSLTRGLGAGGFVEVGRRSAELAKNVLAEDVKYADLVFIIAGMGGGTGTGAAPIIAQLAKDRGAIPIGIVTTPLKVERAHRISPDHGIAMLSACSDAVILLDNQKILEAVPNLSMEQAFIVMDNLIAETIKAIVDMIMKPSLVDVDFNDLKSVMNAGNGIAILLTGETQGKDCYRTVVSSAFNNPLYDADYRKAAGALVIITGGQDMELKDAEDIITAIVSELPQHVKLIWCATIRKEYQCKAKVTMILTGIDETSKG
jgi:cell division protein FtsZ